jgi:hypothetical protein
MTELSTAAWIAHDLGLAASLGGALFGRVALHPALCSISDRSERGRIAEVAWRRFRAIQIPGLALMAGTWLLGRSRLSGSEIDSLSHKLVILKDALVAGTLVSAVGTAVLSHQLTSSEPSGVPMDGRGHVASDAPLRERRLERAISKVGLGNLLLGAGVAAVTTVLAMRAGRSARWSVVSRFLK